MKLTRIFLMAATILALASGCGVKKKEITSLQRKEAANLVSEAQFAVTLRDYARAEGVLAKAAELCPDTAEYWISLGSARMRLGQRDAAKKAYQSGLAAYEQEAAEKKTDPQPVLQQVTVLALLGRVDEARALLEKIPARFPDNRTIRAAVEGKMLDRMLADPKFKEVAL